ncbi:helix-turn-helix domain-containing protein, partial [Brevundimonas sp.]|uniref:helix-turn-helix domain-containing protein n=1 Tax=Brevundimonas sp. TaxID=1871086 RepID=UPI00391A8845
LAALSQATRVHSRYLIALEQNDFSALPSRVFSIGYVRAYASELGLDEQLAIERFKRESPDPSVPLQPPVGVAFEEVRRHSPRVIAAVAILVLAVVGWNVFQRVSLIREAHPSDIAEVPESWTLGAVPGQTAEQGLRLSGPLPAPPDQTVPAFYVTRGLEEQLANVEVNGTTAALTPVSVAPVQKAFNPR